ncbi:unnamed protein product (macronuclear) [Paramecium tetraurelia]|uniref:Carboxypeptidase n=1 Tax=Paramecium tetraurelia TaxID=5888 RepID=A0CBD5_PARTE|nr:uncharacterized protein GSPATT00036885001 [Paramecium tetraurelia]CAK68102.1 unnamed protein product [Paramecium tetraurelia]|eukprot:XP_001435499.1 hypothetical protein (macronuclear) [Paramecium tetraurelia strain d4-2]
MKLIILALLVSTQVFGLQTSCNKLDPKQISDLHDAENLVFSGYLNIFEESASVLAFLFYGHQSAKTVDDLKNYPTLIYLNGLLGETSQIGNFIEVGPIRINSKGTFEKNVNTWNSQFNLLFIDLLVGTGYSYHNTYQDIPTNAEQISAHFVYALEQFLKADDGCVKKQKFTGLETADWYIFGEGYAGKQVVHIASKILDSQSATLNKHLKGIGLGNAHVDANSLLREIPSFAYNLGLVEPRERSELEKIALRGIQQLDKKDYEATHITIQTAIGMIHQFSGEINIQNIDQLTDIEQHISNFKTYLNLQTTKANLKFDENIPFQQSSGEIINALGQDFAKPDALPKLKELQTKLKVLIYNGQNDILCPIPSTLRYLSSINDDFKTKKLEVQIVNDKPAGYTLTSGQLTFVTINNAGFHIPLEKGEVILKIVSQWK